MSHFELTTALVLLLSTGCTGCLTSALQYQNYEDAGSGTLGNRIQALVPGYQFTCPGTVTGWGGCFYPARPVLDRYHVIYQIWRETWPGCYHLVGSTSTATTITDSTHLLILEDGCNTTILTPEKYISVQQGDVVGFFIDYWYSLGSQTSNSDSAGFQLLTAEEHTLFYAQMSPDATSIGDTVGTVAGGCMDVLPDAELLGSIAGDPMITAIFEPAMTPQPAPSLETRESDSSSEGDINPLFSNPQSTKITTSPTTSPITALEPSLDITTGKFVGGGNTLTSYQTLALAGSLLALFNILLILVSILLIALYILRRARRRRNNNNHDINPPRVMPASTGEIDSVEVATRQADPSQALGGDTRSQEDRMSMISNCLYSVSPVIGPSSEMGSEGRLASSSKGHLGSPRSAVTSMIYNRLYGSYPNLVEKSNGAKSAAPPHTCGQ